MAHDMLVLRMVHQLRGACRLCIRRWRLRLPRWRRQCQLLLTSCRLLLLLLQRSHYAYIHTGF